jgi:hypothetical protein
MMSASESRGAVGDESASTDCGLCTHPAHNIRECSAVNDFGQCPCWWYIPVAEYAARCAA